MNADLKQSLGQRIIEAARIAAAMHLEMLEHERQSAESDASAANDWRSQLTDQRS